jgi:hypothetical protein
VRSTAFRACRVVDRRGNHTEPVPTEVASAEPDHPEPLMPGEQVLDRAEIGTVQGEALLAPHVDLERIAEGAVGLGYPGTRKDPAIEPLVVGGVIR